MANSKINRFKKIRIMTRIINSMMKQDSHIIPIMTTIMKTKKIKTMIKTTIKIKIMMANTINKTTIKIMTSRITIKTTTNRIMIKIMITMRSKNIENSDSQF